MVTVPAFRSAADTAQRVEVTESATADATCDGAVPGTPVDGVSYSVNGVPLSACALPEGATALALRLGEPISSSGDGWQSADYVEIEDGDLRTVVRNEVLVRASTLRKARGAAPNGVGVPKTHTTYREAWGGLPQAQESLTPPPNSLQTPPNLRLAPLTPSTPLPPSAAGEPHATQSHPDTEAERARPNATAP